MAGANSGNRIVAARMKRMALQNSSNRQIAALQRAILLDRFLRVGGTGGRKPAAGGEMRADGLLIKPDQKEQQPFRYQKKPMQAPEQHGLCPGKKGAGAGFSHYNPLRIHCRAPGRLKSFSLLRRRRAHPEERAALYSKDTSWSCPWWRRRPEPRWPWPQRRICRA